MSETPVVGRFAPSPTGPLHIGSLVAAVGSWLSARSQGGRWLVRMEDLDTPRVRPGSADEILAAVERYGLSWDGTVEFQSERHRHYADALERLRSMGLAYDCGCSRADLQRAGSAPAAGDETDASVYPGICRDGLPPGKAARAIRFRVPNGTISFDDAVRGRVQSDLASDIGDFVIRRADGIWAYQLAVVVDDALQGVTEVVRGGDLIDSTARQIALQRALGFSEPRYAHLPLIVGSDGRKIGKRDGALPLPALDPARIAATLRWAIQANACDVEPGAPEAMLNQALTQFSFERIRAADLVRGYELDGVDHEGAATHD
jgi:glutamyl-Q tRNA(Asp) synthetase